MFGIGGFELFLIVVFAFLIIGPDKLPAIAKSAGKAVAKFRDAKNEVDKVIKTEVYDPNADDPFKAPIDTLQKMGESVENAKSGETFSERKARYDAERAAERKAAQKAKQAEEAAATAAAAATVAVDAAGATGMADAAGAARAAEASGSNGGAVGTGAADTVSAEHTQAAAFNPAELYTAQPIVEVSSTSASEQPAQSVQPAHQPEEAN